jgi:hypothetical protein
MKSLIVMIIVLLLIGPLRGRFLSLWRFNAPALIAGVAVLLFAGKLMRLGTPSWFPWALAPLVALGAGAAFKKWLDDVLGKDK